MEDYMVTEAPSSLKVSACSAYPNPTRSSVPKPSPITFRKSKMGCSSPLLCTNLHVTYLGCQNSNHFAPVLSFQLDCTPQRPGSCQDLVIAASIYRALLGNGGRTNILLNSHNNFSSVN